MIRRPCVTSCAGALTGVVVLLATAVGCSGSSVPGATSDTATDPARVVADATAALRRRPIVAITIEGTATTGSSTAERPIAATGVLSGDHGGWVHLTATEAPGAARPVETYLTGDEVVVTTTLPDIDRPWTRFDTSVLDAATAPDRERVLPSTDDAVMLAVFAREPSPLTALEVLDHATHVDARGAEEVDGRSLQRYDATTPADAVLDAYGSAVAGQASVDCQLGVVTTVWLDDTGALVRLETTFDHLALGASVVVTFAEGGAEGGAGDGPQDVPDDVPDRDAAGLDPPDDQVYDLTAMVSTVRPGPRRASDWPRPRPCDETGTDAEPGRWARTCPDDDADLDRAWGELERRAQRDPLAAGRSWLGFSEPRPIADAIAVGPGARVTGYVAVYPSTGAMTTTATFSGVDVTIADDVVEQIRTRANPADDASDPLLAAILVDGTWQALADEAVDCGYRVPELAPWAPAPRVGAS